MGFKSSFLCILASFVHPYLSWDSSLHLSSFEFILASLVHQYCSWDSSLHLSSFWHHLSINIAHGIRVFIWVNFGIICPSILLMGFKSSFEFILASFVLPYCSWDSIFSWVHLSSFWHHLSINMAHGIQVFTWVHFGIICPSILLMIFESSFEVILASFVHQYRSWDSSLHLCSFWHHLSIHIAHDIWVFIWVHFGKICPSILLMGFKSPFELILASFVHPYYSWDSTLHLSSFWDHLSIHVAHDIWVFICGHFGIICQSILLMGLKSSFVFILASFVHPYCSWDSSFHLSSFEFILASFVHQYYSWDSTLHLSLFWHHLYIHIAHDIWDTSLEFILESFVHPYCSWDSNLDLSSFEFILASFVHQYCS